MTCCPINELLFDVVNSLILGGSACRIREKNIVEWWINDNECYDHSGGGIMVHGGGCGWDWMMVNIIGWQ